MTKLKAKSKDQLEYHNTNHPIPIHHQCPYCMENMDKMQSGLEIDPAKISSYTKEELLNFYLRARDTLGVLEATRQELGREILSRMKTDGEMLAHHALTKGRRIDFKIDLEKARELGAVKEMIDTVVLKKLHLKGVKIPHTITEYLIVRQIEEKE
ncbi:MAG: hypothetical protein FJZ16_02490 [Candidatus Omnitrophica bacterium]|nr:hypothetical protein [Candidatus Omnitrophota bacterium]